MTANQFEEYLLENPTIEGIVEEMKTWWSDEGGDLLIQMALDKILEISKKQEEEKKTLMDLIYYDMMENMLGSELRRKK